MTVWECLTLLGFAAAGAAGSDARAAIRTITAAGLAGMHCLLASRTGEPAGRVSSTRPAGSTRSALEASERDGHRTSYVVGDPGLVGVGAAERARPVDGSGHRHGVASLERAG